MLASKTEISQFVNCLVNSQNDWSIRMGYVINLTNQTLPILNFLIKTSALYQTLDDLTEIYFRKIKVISNTILKSHFVNETQRVDTGFKGKSNRQWLPKDTHHSVKTFIEAVDKDLSRPTEKQATVPYNFTKDERKALESFR